MSIDLEAIKAELAAITPGPWAWFGDVKHKNMQLATTHSGRRYVMTFQRWGMQGAQPWFQTGIGMVPAAELAVKQAEYRGDIARIEHPDAQFIAKAPTLVADLLAEIDRLRNALETVRDPYYSDPEHISEDGCPDNPCPACHRQIAEAQHRAQEVLYPEPS